MDIEKFVKELLSDARVQGAVVQIMEAVMDLLGRATQAPQPEIQEAQPVAAPVPEPVAVSAAELVPTSVSEVAPVAALAPMQKKQRCQTTDFSALSKDSLRAAYKYRKKLGMELEPELHAELVRRFPTYDAKNQKFGLKLQKTDFTKSSDDSLRGMYHLRRTQGKEIEPELNAELARRFPGYDATTQKFGLKSQKTDFTQSSDDSLRGMYHLRRNHGKELEPELHAELVRRFPTYDAETQKFGLKLQKTDFTKSSDDSLRAMYHLRRNQGKELEPELHAELARRFPTYDAATQKFIGHENRGIWSQPKLRREYDFASRTNQCLRAAFYNRLQKGLPIEPELDAELARRFPTYDAKTQRFTGQKQKSDAMAVQPTAPAAVPAPEPQDITPAPASRKVVPTIVKDLKRSAPQPGELHVTLKEVKLTLQDVYNDVLVNGRPILKNHANTRVCTLLGGALLAVHGVVTGRKDLPQKPLWLIFNTRLEENRFVSRDKYSGYNTYITSVRETPSRVHVECSNKSTLLLERDKYERIAAGSRFILDEKTK